MEKGIIKKLMRDRGFGFIRTDQGEEVFFHRTECSVDFDSLEQGQQVGFDVEIVPKGPRAKNVKGS